MLERNMEAANHKKLTKIEKSIAQGFYVRHLIMIKTKHIILVLKKRSIRIKHLKPCVNP